MPKSVYHTYLEKISSIRGGLCVFESEDGVRCSETAIASHTVQRSRVLGDICEDGHVLNLTLERSAKSGTSGVQFRKIGVRKASVFPGFCQEHDRNLFQSIETGTGLITKEEAAVLSYRAICHEMYKKESIISAFTDEELKGVAARNGSIRFIEAHVHGCRRALNDLRRAKRSHLSYLHGQIGRLSAVVFDLSASLPFAFATAFAPEYRIGGDDILPPEKSEWGSVSCFSGQIKGRSIVLFAGFDDVPHHPVSSFMDSLAELPARRIGGFALHVGIEFAENFYFRPSWVGSLLPEVRNELAQRFSRGVPGLQSREKKEISSQFDIVNLHGAIRIL